jgi:hypothetical protein
LPCTCTGTPSGHASELRDREARVDEQGPAGTGAGLRELLGDRDPEGEAGVDGLGADPVGGGDAALGQRAEPRFTREGHAVLDRVEGAPVEEVGRVHGVACLPQLAGERLHSVGQPLDVVVQHDFGHLRSSRAIDPCNWNILRC